MPSDALYRVPSAPKGKDAGSWTGTSVAEAASVTSEERTPELPANNISAGCSDEEPVEVAPGCPGGQPGLEDAGVSDDTPGGLLRASAEAAAAEATGCSDEEPGASLVRTRPTSAGGWERGFPLYGSLPARRWFL